MSDDIRFGEALRRHRLVAILRDVDPSTLEKRVAALHGAGIRLIEVALSDPSALATLDALVRIAPDDLMVGAGTVTTVATADAAHNAGAKYLVTPHVAADVFTYASSHRLGLLAGAMTPSEIALARDNGASFIKLFPAASVGPGFVKALLGPYPDLDIVVVGGVGSTNLGAFLSAGALGAGVGGALASGNAADEFAEAAAEARALVELLAAHPS